ncbi:MAG: lysophospholipid acyltransferase family protein [Bdellovibrionales bacterium]
MKLLLILRGLFLPLFLIVLTGFCCIIALSIVWFTGNRVWEFAILRFWSRTILQVVGIELEVTGLENIPDRSCIFVFNHQSLLDIPVVHTAIPRDFRFGAKIELFRIPVFGATMRSMRVLPIARGQRDEAIKVLEQAASRINNGESFILAPEGTRQKVPRIGDFKSGPFMVAMKAKAPMVPIVINGLDEVMPKKAWLIHTNMWKSRVRVQILPAIDGAEFNLDARNAFKDRVRLAMHEAFELGRRNKSL